MSQPQAPANEASWPQLERLLEQAREALQHSDYRNLDGALRAAGQLVARLTAADPPPLSPAQKERILKPLAAGEQNDVAVGVEFHLADGARELQSVEMGHDPITDDEGERILRKAGKSFTSGAGG